MLAPPTLGQTEPLRVRRNLFGMHNLKDGGPAYDIGMEWTQHLNGPGFVFDWVTDINPWIEKAFQLGLIPCIRVQECNGGCTPDPGYAGQVASVICNYKLAHPQYADRIVYLQLWNEPSDPRDSVPPNVYANYLINAHNAVHSVENAAAQSDPDIAGTLKTMTPGQNGPSWWTQAVTANPDCKFAFDVWGTHPYPEATPPHYNLHDGDIYIETSKSIDSYLMDLDVIASPHGNPPRSRRGFPVMITETAYGDHLGISYEGWPKTSRQMAADYNVDAFSERWYKWPEIIAVHPFILANVSWEAFAFVQSSSGSVDVNPADGVREPTAPYPQYTAVRDLRIQLEGAPPSGRNMAPARLTPYRGPKGTITGTITRSDNGQPVTYATLYTDGWEFGNVSLYDGGYTVTDVPAATYTLTCSKNGYVSSAQQITVTDGQTTTANFSLVFSGKVSKGFYFVDTFNGDCGCSGCNLSATYLGQSFTTPSDVYFMKYAACKPNVDNVTMRFSIRQGNNPNGTQIGSAITGTLELGVGGNMIGAEWPDGQEPQLQPNTQYTLRIERTDGASQYCYASNCNPYAGGHAWVGSTAQTGWDFYSCMRGLTQQVVTATGTISGTVKDTSDNPISGADVVTSPGNYSAVSSGTGAYTISNVPVGTYSVTASQVGYSPQTLTNQVVTQGQTTTANFNLAAGPTTGTISGTIKDTSDNPISGATVDTTTGGYSTTTAANGTYTLSNVAPGTYTVRAAKTGYLTNQQTGVNVTAGQTATVNINLAPIAPFSGVANGNMEGGSFNDPDVDHKTANSWHQYILAGAPKSNVTWLGTGAHSANYVQDFYESNWTAGIYQQATNASVSNAYRAAVWVKGTTGEVNFWVGVDPTGGTSASSPNVVWSNPVTPGTTWTQIYVDAIAESTTITLFVKAQNTAALNRNGYVDDASLTDLGPTSTGTISGTVKDASDSPINGATVQTTTGGYSTTTNASGQYTLANVAVGTYDVTASKSGYQSQTQTQVSVMGSETTTVNFTLQAAPASGTIDGFVKDTANNPISGATVQTNTGGYSTTTDASGAYTLGNVTPGTYNVTASKSGYTPQTQNGITVASGQTTTVNFNLASAAPFSGLANGDMEGGAFNDPDVDHKTANSWHKFVLAAAPKHGVIWMGSGAHSANYDQEFWEASYTAGIYQQCTNATVGNTYTASVWVKGENTSLNFWIGIDPTGGTDAASANVQWSAQSTPGATWTQISKQVTASSTTITVFLKCQNTAGASRVSRFDDAVCTSP